MNEAASISFGERDGSLSGRVQAIANLMAGARIEAHASQTILPDMWEKWVFLATLAGCTCLMRAAIGDIAAAPDGTNFALRVLNECTAVAGAEGSALQASVFCPAISPGLMVTILPSIDFISDGSGRPGSAQGATTAEAIFHVPR